MKNLLYSIFLATIILFTSCSDDEDIPNADWDRPELASLSATASNAQVTLNWELLENSNSIGLFITWKAGKSEIKGGELRINEVVSSTIIKELVNNETYTFTVQPIYTKGNGGVKSVKAKPTN